MLASWRKGVGLRYHRGIREALASGDPVLVCLDRGAHLSHEGLLRLVEAALGGASPAYGAFDTPKGIWVPPPYDGDITERFPFGPVRAWRRDLLPRDAVEMEPAWEYHSRLVLEERGILPRRVDGVLGFWQPQELLGRPEATLSWAYLSGPPEWHRAVERAFKAALRRRGAYLGPRPREAFPRRGGSPRVSVVIPVRNRRELVVEAIGSVLAGDFRDFEVLVVDNASTDGTPQAVEAIRDPRVRLIRNPMGNIAFALNAGLRHARGEFLARLDSDDLLAPEALSEMVKAMDENPSWALAISYYLITDPSGSPLGHPVKHLEFDRNNILRTDGAGAMRFWRTEALRRLGGYSEAFGDFGEDYDAVLRATERWPVGRVHRVLYYYRRHPASTDARRSQEQKRRRKTAIRRLALARRRLINRAERLGLLG